MNIELFAKNLLIRKQALEAVRALESAGVETILLKGVALMEIAPWYSYEREVEDIDILIKPGRLGRAVSALESACYSRRPSDPCTFEKKGCVVPVDLCEGLWYLTSRENERVFNEPAQAGEFRVLPSDEFLINLHAHSLFQHAKREKKWERDIEVLRMTLNDMIDNRKVEEKLAGRGLKDSNPLLKILISSKIPQMGHITRFIFLPLKLKIAYISNLIFPSEDFIIGRYNAGGRLQILIYRFIRPFALFGEFIKVVKGEIC